MKDITICCVKDITTSGRMMYATLVFFIALWINRLVLIFPSCCMYVYSGSRGGGGGGGSGGGGGGGVIIMHAYVNQMSTKIMIF